VQEALEPAVLVQEALEPAVLVQEVVLDWFLAVLVQEALEPAVLVQEVVLDPEVEVEELGVELVDFLAYRNALILDQIPLQRGNCQLCLFRFDTRRKHVGCLGPVRKHHWDDQHKDFAEH